MKLSVSNLAWLSEADQSKVNEILDKYDVKFVEIAKRKKNYSEILESGKSVASMQSIISKKEFSLFSSELDRSLIEIKLFKAISDAQNLNCNHIVYGCPATRSVPDFDRSSKFDAAMSEIIEMFREVADHSNDVVVGFEPVSERYGSQFVNNFREAVKFVKKVNRDNFKVNLDLANVLETGVRFEEIKRDIKYVSHVHVSEIDLKEIKYHEIVKDVLSFIESDDELREKITVSIEAVDLSLEELDRSLSTIKKYLD